MSSHQSTLRELPYGRQFIDDDDIGAVVAALKGDWITQGPSVTAFEMQLAEATGTRLAVAVSSGTAALHVAYLAAGLGPGDEIITTPITFAATANAARLCGAEVKFVDIDPQTLCINPAGIERAINKSTKILAPVDFAGLPCAADDINRIAQKHGLKVVSDAAHSLGASFHGRPVGSLADMTCFSFHPVKSITTGEGGAVVTQDESLADAMRLLRSHGIKHSRHGYTLAAAAMDDEGKNAAPHTDGPAGWYSEMIELGLNYRITDLQCALGLSQLTKLKRFVERRREIAERYRAAFRDHPAITLQHVPAELQSAWHLFVIRLRLDRLKASRRTIYDELAQRGIKTQVHYIPTHLHPYYRNRYQHRRGDFPAAEAYYDSCLSLPLFPAMTDEDADYVIQAVTGLLAQHAA